MSDDVELRDLVKTPPLTASELLVHHLGPLVANVAAEFKGHSDLWVLEQIITRDPGLRNRNLIDLVRDEDAEALRVFLAFYKQ